MTGPRVLGCLLLLAVVDVLIRVAGMRATLRLAAGSTVRRRGVPRDIEKTTALVALASAFYPRRALCLEQALVLCWLLRHGGRPAELRLGVQPRPFRAHAWVEVEGRAVAERADLVNMVAFPRLAG